MGRLIGGLILIAVLYFVISQPLAAAEATRGWVSALGVVGDRVVVFVTSVVGGPGSTTLAPTGGVETGDGSSVPPAP